MPVVLRACPLLLPSFHSNHRDKSCADGKTDDSEESGNVLPDSSKVGRPSDISSMRIDKEPRNEQHNEQGLKAWYI